jgi:chromate transport protein ChrA
MWLTLSLMAAVFVLLIAICWHNYRRQRNGFWRALLIVTSVFGTLFLLLFVLPPVLLLFQ